ncbi:MAG: triose-phosphate isomerase, partial [Candidatus Thermoplasmatota archaeon]|nr:triose-phosphate isomerase [Candidatus Thermoplasmatota archaeon]
MTPQTLAPPLVVINYKVYPSTLGQQALALTRKLEGAAASYPEATVAICPSHAELGILAGQTELPVLAQTSWGDDPGSGTGKVLVESLEDLGVAGSLINHAECQVSREHAAKAVEKLNDAGLTSIVCTADEEAT